MPIPLSISKEQLVSLTNQLLEDFTKKTDAQYKAFQEHLLNVTSLSVQESLQSTVTTISERQVALETKTTARIESLHEQIDSLLHVIRLRASTNTSTISSRDVDVTPLF